jgi:integrase
MTRGKGEGSVYKRESDGMWVGVVELPARDGKRRRYPVYGATKTIVLAKKQEAERRLSQHGDIETDSMTLGKFMDYWLREVVERTRRPQTASSYHSVSKRYIVPLLGKVRLTKLTAVHVRKLHAYVTGELGKSSTTARNAHSVLSAALKDAMREGRMQANPCAVVAMPPKALTHLDTLSTDEVRALFRNNRDNPDMYLWATYILTGNRRGEVLGLEWDRIENGVIDLSWQLQRLPLNRPWPPDYEVRPLLGGMSLVRPKTKSGYRVIPLVEPLAGMLDEWRTIAPDNPWGLVFTREALKARNGNRILPLDPKFIDAQWAEFAARQWPGRRIRLHDLRHTAVDLLLEAGVPEDVIEEICGWSARAMVQHYKSKTKLARREAGMHALSAHLALES